MRLFLLQACLKIHRHSRGLAKEMIPVLHGKYSLEEAEALIAKNTRHFAKRQLTWYRRMPYIHWVERTDTDTWLREIEAYVISWIRGESEWKGK